MFPLKINVCGIDQSAERFKIGYFPRSIKPVTADQPQRNVDDKASMISIRTCVVPLKDRSTYISVEYGILDVQDGAFVLRDVNGVRTSIPVAGLACIMLGPGTTITHAAVSLAADVRCLLIWTGEGGVRLYSAGMPGGSRCDRLLNQARAALIPECRLEVIRRMYQYRFEESLDPGLSVEQMRGKEAARVKRIYAELSREYGVEWNGRRYDAANWRSADPINRCISSATSCLYGLSEAAILIAGYSPAIGFVHTGRPRSFVYDVADLIKYETAVPVAFKVASEQREDFETHVRHECREMFARRHTLESLVPLINSIFSGLEADDVDGVVPSPDFSSDEGRCYDGSDYRERSEPSQGEVVAMDVRIETRGVPGGLQLQAS